MHGLSSTRQTDPVQLSTALVSSGVVLASTGLLQGYTPTYG